MGFGQGEDPGRRYACVMPEGAAEVARRKTGSARVCGSLPRARQTPASFASASKATRSTVSRIKPRARMPSVPNQIANGDPVQRLKEKNPL